MMSRRLSRREMAVLCGGLSLALVLAGGLQLALGWGAAQLRAGEALRTDTLRLHIRAASDTFADQTAKLAVRDAVLAELDAHCPAQSRDSAREWAAQQLPELELLARQVLAARGCAPRAAIELVEMYFPTSRYAGGQLPAGRYEAVRITLGAGERSGKNWWCVLYPGLCRTACGGYARPEENDLVCGEYVVRFWLVDAVQKRRAACADVPLLRPGTASAPAA